MPWSWVLGVLSRFQPAFQRHGSAGLGQCFDDQVLDPARVDWIKPIVWHKLRR